jgi:2,3-bisphosphoglycerate-independent phosphoglycerate mutase
MLKGVVKYKVITVPEKTTEAKKIETGYSSQYRQEINRWTKYVIVYIHQYCM